MIEEPDDVHPPTVSDPYRDVGLVVPPYGAKSLLIGRMCALVNLVYPSRALQIMTEKSRVVRNWDIHELMLAPSSMVPDLPARGLRVLGFVEFLSGGVLVAGDRLLLDGDDVGELVGFDGTHSPNHLNIVIRASTEDVEHIDVRLGSSVSIGSSPAPAAVR